MAKSHSFIPEVWQKQMIEEVMRRHGEHSEGLRTYLDTLPKSPRHKVLWRRFVWRMTSAREWAALKIAPWLREQW